MHPVIPFVVAAVLFGLGVYGVLARRNAVLLLMSVELMLNAVNLIFVTADATVRSALPQTGQVFALFVIVLAAAEVGVGLALILQLYRRQASIAVDEIPLADPAGRLPDEPTAGRPVAGLTGGAEQSESLVAGRSPSTGQSDSPAAPAGGPR